ncbi:MAG TPA: diguanylate cyclase [Dehalococcoidia bacterium]|nr:diguanylate cyclase [Dehalococcoidia bacterium]
MLGAIAFVPVIGMAVTAIFVVAQLAIWRKAVETSQVGYTLQESKVLSLMERSNDARRNSIRDESTGLLNRWYLERRLEEEAGRCKRYGYSMAVVVLKCAILDRSGISADGWQVESATAAHRCAQVIRTVDLSSSLAPFEFAICLVHCDEDGAQRAIDRMIAEMKEYECSVGVAVYPDDDCQPRAMIELARVRSRRMAA